MTRERVCAIGAVALALCVLFAGVRWGSTVAGGSDSYGYVSQAGLWRQGTLTIHQDVVGEFAWPFAHQTWTPLGYVPAGDSPDAIVPSYAPGFPLLMMLAQIVGGYCAAFFVVPICGALTVWSTYELSRRVFGRPAVALGGALLVAASPVFIFQLMIPMSDVPVTAAWTLALVLAAANRPLSAGLAAAAAVAIRPNLAPLAMVLLVWLAVTRPSHIVRAAIGVAPAVIGIACLNARLYGSPFRSGYGSLDDIYAIRHLPTNVRQFTEWTMDVQTPIVALAALSFVAPRWMPARVPAARLLLGGTIAVILGSYLFYRPFDAWWYLRFLLPMWPVLMLLTVVGLTAIACRWTGRLHPIVVAVVLLGLTLYGVRVAVARHGLDTAIGERRYAAIGRFLAHLTDRNAVVLSMQHSGSIRLYADRLTLRYDLLDPAWLDRAVEQLRAAGRHPYIVLDEFEEPAFRKQFGAVSPIGAIDWQPIAIYELPRVAIYDAIDRANQHPPLVLGLDYGGGAWRCEPPEIWPPRLRMK
ncbi:MAG TPA: glycosyltransferase family 39 protein [Vicinamibacterales bacterium]|nr:glycosyltransferase family 39 protein [Vicinamibacterales bacterium]